MLIPSVYVALVLYGRPQAWWRLWRNPLVLVTGRMRGAR